jgi:glycosyltransferase involved in cell wall biosynthesis
MKVLVVLSLYSGFEGVLETGVWRPAGTPAIAKLIEALDRTCSDLRIFLLAKRDGQKYAKGRYSLEGLVTQPTFLPRVSVLPGPLARFHWYLNEIAQSWLIVCAYLRQKPDVVYIDRANVFVGGFFARFTRTPVVFRLLGVHRTMHPVVAGRRPFHFLTRWAYRSPFAVVICSQDGSGGEIWLDKLIQPQVPRRILVNGVDDIPKDAEVSFDPPVSEDKTVVTFLGRLELEKGCDEFIEAFLEAWRKDRHGLYALIVGDGSRRDALRQVVSEAGAMQAVNLMGALPHDKVQSVLVNTDIYVSLNQMGNLSNANLEAMKAGCCMVFPASQPETGADLATDELFPDDTVLRIPSAHDTTALSEAILRLHLAPDERRKRADAIRQCAAGFLSGWNERISQEINLLEDVVARRPVH